MPKPLSAQGATTYEMRFPPVHLHILGRVLHPPGIALAARDQVAQARRREEQEGDDAHNVEPRRVAIVVFIFGLQAGLGRWLGLSLGDYFHIFFGRGRLGRSGFDYGFAGFLRRFLALPD